MTRRITRTLIQGAAFLTIILVLVFIADHRYRVLPTSLHVHLPLHHSGSVITDINIVFCSSANPFSTCRLDPLQWRRLEKDLYLNSGWLNSAWMHVQRQHEGELSQDDVVVMDVRVGRSDPSAGAGDESGNQWEWRPGGIWLLRSKRTVDFDSQRVVTAVDLLFGADAVDPRPGWTLARTPLLIDENRDSHAARLSIRRGQPTADKRVAVPRVRKNGRFKILQISDAHVSTGVGKCRDAIGIGGKPSRQCEADPRTLEFLETVLDDEKPDLVILSGDQVEGPAAPDTQSALFKIVAPLAERRIPYAAIFGNHDDEGMRSLPRATQMSLLETLPYSLSRAGDESVSGVGNYYVEIPSHSSDTSALTIYLLDSHSLSPDEHNYKGYDWIKQDQIDWFRTLAQSLKKAHARYSHIHMNMAFVHIPLPEYQDPGNVVVGGQWREGVTSPKYNSHFYDALVAEGVLAVGCGHDHVNDYCAIRPPTADSPSRAPGPYLCYAGGAGFGGYAGYGGFHRRVRMWEMDTNAGRMTTWKRVECCGPETQQRVDEIVLVEGGQVVVPS